MNFAYSKNTAKLFPKFETFFKVTEKNIMSIFFKEFSEYADYYPKKFYLNDIEIFFFIQATVAVLFSLVKDLSSELLAGVDRGMSRQRVNKFSKIQ